MGTSEGRISPLSKKANKNTPLDFALFFFFCALSYMVEESIVP